MSGEPSFERLKKPICVAAAGSAHGGMLALPRVSIVSAGGPGRR
ncbi:hypothetical protein BN130_1 [Cronobacter malonaticus 507]|nr:hypothetical protein BN130_1 [Cronobacter malonaticus 507]